MKKRFGQSADHQTFWGVLFASPWFIGFSVFGLIPIIASFYFSMCRYNVVRAPIFIGLENYKVLLSDTIFLKSLWNTFYFLILGLPLQLLFAFSLALLLNAKVVARGFFRTVFYLPSLVPVVASAILWKYLLNPQFGLVNNILMKLGASTGPGWLADPFWAKPALIIMNLWMVGNTMIIFLAALQQVSKSLYEAAQIDGASKFQQILYITIPSIKPVILFNVIMGVIATFQYFTQVYVMTTNAENPGEIGGPEYATMLYPLYLYQYAFQFFRMGYASALAWIMFILIGICIFLILRMTREEK